MYIEGLKPNKILVSEIFKSYQGEGPYSGTPSLFIRFALCNLYCSWCDTKYSWLTIERAKILGMETESTKTSFAAMESEELYNIISNYRNTVSHIVLTGGEPLIWRFRLQNLLYKLKSDGWFIEVETNGTISPYPIVNYIDHFNVSPKLANSGIPYRIRIIDNVLKIYSELARKSKAVFKFVVSSFKDLDEIELLIDRYEIPRNRIILMSECASRNKCIEMDKKTIVLARKLGVGFTRRHHIIHGYR